MSDDDSDDDEEYRAIVIDNGTGMIKAGFAGDSVPRIEFPTRAGINSGSYVRTGQSPKYWIGDEWCRFELPWKYPIEDGIVTNWYIMEKIWNYTFNIACSSFMLLEEHPVLMSEAPLNPKANREKMIKIMFESFSVPAFYVAVQAVLALYASGRDTGIVADCGYGVTYTVPIYQGHVLNEGVCILDVAGRDLTHYLMKLLTETGYTYYTEIQRFQIVEHIKETLGYVTVDFDAEMKKAETSSDIEKKYELPDGQVITIGTERFRCSEVLFKPQLIGKKSDGLTKLILKSINNCNPELKKDLLGNIVLNGGSTMFKGIEQRLYNDLIQLVLYKNLVDGYLREYATNKIYGDIVSVTYDYCGVNKDSIKYAGFDKVNIIATRERKYNAWIGGSILSSISDFDDYWITKHEYDESGPYIVHRKCF